MVQQDFMADGLRINMSGLQWAPAWSLIVTFILRTNEYMGAGAELIEKAVENGQADTFAFFLENGAYCTDYACRIPWGRDRTFFLHRSHLWLCDG